MGAPNKTLRWTPSKTLRGAPSKTLRGAPRGAPSKVLMGAPRKKTLRRASSKALMGAPKKVMKGAPSKSLRGAPLGAPSIEGLVKGLLLRRPQKKHIEEGPLLGVVMRVGAPQWGCRGPLKAACCLSVC